MPSEAVSAETPAAFDGGSDLSRPYTNFQWYLSTARNTVYFAAYTPVRFTEASFKDMVRDVMALAPQLNLRNDDRGQAHVDTRPFDLDRILSFEELVDFDGFPDRVLGPNDDLFRDPDLPSFRASCFTLAEGTNADGNRSFVLYRASHALMEGVDTAQVLRGRPSDHSKKPSRTISRPLGRLMTGLIAAAAMPLNFIIMALHWRRNDNCMLRTKVLSRRDIKRVASEIGVPQRTLIFALIMYGLYYGGGRKPLRPRIIGYSNLSPRRFEGDDDFVRLRMQATTVGSRSSFAEYAKALDAKLSKAGRESLGLQMHYNSIFGVHRQIVRLFPFLYGKRFFGFVPYDFLLSLVPPHTPGGVFAKLSLNDVYCGTHMAGVNCCVIVPQADRVSLSIYCPSRVLGRMSEMDALLDELGISGAPATGAIAPAINARSPADA